LDVPFDGHSTYIEKLVFFSFVLAEKDPVIKAYSLEVFPLAPSCSLGSMSPRSPTQ
jgi:hypothetical protein